MNRQPDITAQTRQNLMDAFWSLYRDHRIEKISVKDITLKAGYNRSTFYEYFTDVYDVLEQIENLLIPTMEELPPRKKTGDRLDMPFDLFLKLYEKNSDYYSVLFGDNGDPSFSSKMKNTLKPLMKESMADKVEGSDTELDFIIEYMLSAMLGVVSYWFRSDKRLPAEDLVLLMYQLMDNELMHKIRQ